MVNKVTLIGNLGQEPSVKRLESGVAVANFSVATSKRYKDKNDEWHTKTEWHNVVAWRNLAEMVEKKLEKGSTVYVEGELQTREYDDKDGIKRRVTDVVAFTVKALSKKESDTEQKPQHQEPSATSSPADDDLPF